MQRPNPHFPEPADASRSDAAAPSSAEAPPGRLDPFVVGRLLAAVAVVALAILLIGGYTLGWTWTGFGDNDRLYDYLHLLVLPIVIAALPVWLKTRRDRAREWRWATTLLLAAFAVLLVGGYALGWTWTGFGPITLWDWLDLLVLPVVLSLMPLWLGTHDRLESRWIAGLGVALAVFVVLVVGGYALGWTWTGFPGNTVWDWLRLLLVPFALPAALTWYQISGRRYRDELRHEIEASEAPAS